MDGEVQLDIFTPGSEPANRDVTRTEMVVESSNIGSASEEVTDRLADLGYME
jgi:hypothetical protein